MVQLRVNKEDEEEFITFKLVEKLVDTHDTFKFIFEIPNNLCLGLDIGMHIVISETIKTKQNPEGESVSRKYSPVSYFKDRGSFVLLIKIYYANVHPNFPDGGKMTQYIDTLVPGDFIKVRGPVGRFLYLGNGFCRLKE